MNIYLISADCDYDEYDGFVIIASTPKRAREIAADNGMSWNNRREVWLSPHLSEIEMIGTTHREKEEVILGSYNAG